MNWLHWLGLLCIILIAGSLLIVLEIRKKIGLKGKYSKKELLTDNEKEFFSRLIRALPECYVYPQVALSAFLKVECKNSQERNRLRNKFAQKYADFIVTDQSLNILAIVELDDKTHNLEKDKARDAMLNSAGYSTLRYQSKHKPQPEKIRDDFIAIVQRRS